MHIYVSGEEIISTANHPFYVEGKGWMEAGNLKKGDIVYIATGDTIKIQKVFLEHLQLLQMVYNLNVENNHTYFVGSGSILVHNKCSKKSGKEKANDVPSWVKRYQKRSGESAHDFAKRILNDKYGAGKWKKGAKTEYNQIIKYINRGNSSIKIHTDTDRINLHLMR